MVKLCVVRSGRWSALLKTGETSEQMPLGIKIEVVIFRNFQQFTSYSFSGKEGRASGPVRSYADLLGCGLSKREAESVRLLIFTTEELCQHLLGGGSVEEWCEEDNRLGKVGILPACGKPTRQKGFSHGLPGREGRADVARLDAPYRSGSSERGVARFCSVKRGLSC